MPDLTVSTTVDNFMQAADAAAARAAIGAGTSSQSLTTTATGLNFLALTNPGAVTFARINADNSVSALSASAFRTAIGAGTSNFDGAYSSLTGAPAAFDPAAATVIQAASGQSLILKSAIGIEKLTLGAGGFDISLAGGILVGGGAAGFAWLFSGGFALDFVFNNSAQRLFTNGNMQIAGGMIYGSADPHVAGAWWDNAGTLTRSAG